MRTAATSALLCFVLSVAAYAEPRAEHEALRTQMNQLYQAGDYAKVIEIATGILAANPGDDVAQYLRGSAKVETGIAQRDKQLLREGIADATAAIQAKKMAANYNYYLPYLYGMTNLGIVEQHPAHAKVSVDVATKLVAQAGIDSESKSNLLYQRGLAKNSLGEGTGAIDDFRLAVGTNPKHLGAFMALADAQDAAGLADAVLVTYQQAAQSFPNEPLVFNNQGMFLTRTKRTNEAIKAFTVALQKNPNYFVSLTNRGFAHLEAGNPAEAEKDFNASLTLNPQQLSVYGLRGTTKLVRGQWKEALVDYEGLVKVDPKNYLGWCDVGFAKFFGKDFGGALDAFNKVIELQPEARFIHPWRVWTLIRLNRGPEAAAVAVASKQKPEAQRDWYDHLVIFHVTGELSSTQLLAIAQKAEKDVQAAQLCEARFFIAEQMQNAGRTQEATQSYQQALQTQARGLSAFRGSQYALKQFQ